MLVKTNFHHARLESLYTREIALIFQKLIQQKELPLFSISYCSLSTKAENLKVYLVFTNEKDQKYLNFISKNYLPVVKKHLAKSKKFARLPKIILLLDQELKKISDLEKIIQKIQ
ncbi:ribosome-binding factor A [endosymbiont GvMRE of Glomus versiforme]|uniref:ribosome-binding factor A n=1 Tax=endosymbiont GvMRE of Glomus versiforme TaxID=2039283 RepID=UPI000ED00FD7|nr:ribosome-binding factor A [endosymbiont GvMRE of Glomus versiforme]RHZ37101.1 hypothetical protein GvMRE_I1g45 [endosymbiont GvMRE of Glomus versiforme]